MHIQKVRGNVKAGVDIEIGPKTLVVGPNGSGKSTLTNVVELALTSRASDISGRNDVAREADVMSLVRNGEKQLYAEVEFDGGAVARYSTEGSTAKAKKASVARPAEFSHEDVLPIRTLREALLGSPQTARKFLLAKVGGGSMPDVEALIPEQLRPQFQNLVRGLPKDTPVSDAIVQVIELAAKQQRDLVAAAKSNREAGKLVSGGRVAPPSDEQIAHAKAKFDDMRVKLTAAQTAANAEAKFESITAMIERTERKADEIAVQLHDRRTRLNSMRLPREMPSILQHIFPVLVESHDAGECLCCGGMAPDAAAVDAVKEALDNAVDARAGYDALAAEVKALSAEAVSVLAQLESLESEAAELRKAQSEVPDVDAASREYDAAENALADIRAAKNAWAAVQKAESAALDFDRQALEWKMLKEACEDAMGMTLDRALAVFVGRVQSYLPKTDVFDLRLRDGDREVVQFGLVRGDLLHTALSGAEWARVMAAMASACVPDGRYACLIPEERAFDASTLKEVLTALGRTPHQVIVTSPVAPNAVPKGWTVVRRGAKP